MAHELKVKWSENGPPGERADYTRLIQEELGHPVEPQTLAVRSAVVVEGVLPEPETDFTEVVRAELEKPEAA